MTVECHCKMLLYPIMKKPLLLSIALLACLVSYAQAEELDGITILPDAYTMKISADGTQVVGTPGDRSTIYYNLDTKDAYYYGNLDFGLGFVVADNGWIVGMDVEDSGKGVIMAGKTVIYPDVFDSYSMSDIHSITPDARRICGVVGNPGYGPTYLPFYCDIDESGNFGQVNILPYPDKDLFGMSPQFSSATWMSADGKTIAGQVVDARGFFIYPILYKENESGEWTISYPAESLFNPNGLPIPEPIPDLEEMFPGVTYPEITDFMSPEAAQEFEEALLEWEAGGFEAENDPYENLDLFMTPEEIEAYEEAAIRYNNALEEYNILFDEYVEQLYRIVDD